MPPIEVDPAVVTPSKKRRAVKKPFVSKKNESMDESVTNFAKSTYNAEFESFERLVDTIRKQVRITVDYRKSVGDDSIVSIAKYTNETIKKGLRSSKWI